MPDAGFGIYLHWPFCQAKCPYCDFNSHVWASIDQDEWAQAYLIELDRLAEETGDRLVRSVFFGGGTPSLMADHVVAQIIDRIARNWRFENAVEITLEANPTSVEADRFQGYRAAGVNRVSLGIQALNDGDLKRLGRLHSAQEALAAYETARRTFERVSFDLIYARQDQTCEGWQAELDAALALGPSHLSLYQLTIEPGTAFGDRFERGRLPGLPHDDLGADLWDITQAQCEEAGLPAYEVSNHARSGEESRHNLIYWTGGEYVGIGPGAHGRLNQEGTRYATEAEKAPGSWLRSVVSGSRQHEQQTALSPTDVWQERLMMGLRLRGGIDLNNDEFACLSNKINGLKGHGLIDPSGNTLKLTERGRPVLNAILAELLAD